MNHNVAATEKLMDYERRRMALLSGPLLALARVNPVIDRIAQEYAYGNIILLEEALAQMVVHMAQNWEARQQEAYQQHVHSMMMTAYELPDWMQKQVNPNTP